MRLSILFVRIIDTVIVHLVVMLFVLHQAVVMVFVLMIVKGLIVVGKSLFHLQDAKPIMMDVMSDLFPVGMLLLVQNVLVSGKVLHHARVVNQDMY